MEDCGMKGIVVAVVLAIPRWLGIYAVAKVVFG